MPSIYMPKAVFDTQTEVIELYKKVRADENPRHIIRQWLQHCLSGAKVELPQFAPKDYQAILDFLYSYRGSSDTFVAYRRDLERLLQWSWFVQKKSVLKLKREDIEAFIEFCIKPYKRWIGLKTVARFKLRNGQKVPNPDWHPFEVRISKQDYKDCKTQNKNDYQFSQQALKTLFGILGSFYNFLIQEELAQVNPVLLIRQKSKFLRKEIAKPTIRRLSEKQWRTVMNLAKEEAKKEIKCEREVFILSCLYGMYLRISELVASTRWTPTMGDFTQDNDGNWWFKTTGKGNKARAVAVSPSMLAALKHYRSRYLQLTPCPMPREKTPLVAHIRNVNSPITSTRPIRQLVQSCFDRAANSLQADGDIHEANLLRSATVHWLRHTGISDDVKIRPREHVRDDAGHSSSAITDRYIDVELKERAASARKKKIIPKNSEDDK
ncbi:MAG: tyrosine-type recombinase/integrase [Gammaproteobacteria bacterium]|nr:tyrosine-type recombinase/integrase [Gammaproteobacteria bacterium]